MLTKGYRFSLIFPLLLICSFDLPDSTIQIIRGVPVFHATNVMPKLNQTKVFKKRGWKKSSSFTELFLISAKYPTSLVSSDNVLHFVGMKYISANSKAAEDKTLWIERETQPFAFGRGKQGVALGFSPHCLLFQFSFLC